MSARKCPTCGSVNPAHADICRECDSWLFPTPKASPGEALPTDASDEARRAATRVEVLSDVDPVVLECWRLNGWKVGAMLREAREAVIELQEQAADAAPSGSQEKRNG